MIDANGGKVRRENYLATKSGADVAIFERDGTRIPFPDFPEHLDVPGKIEFMLWKEKWP
ncbi:hypothetical protein ACFIOY_19455 [Bradyrhizobium sp. TZ2]